MTPDQAGGPGADLRAQGQDDVSFLLALYLGRDPALDHDAPDPNLGLLERHSSAEPSLIPHLPRVTHDFSARSLAMTTRAISEFALPQLWESTQLAFANDGEGGRDLWEQPDHTVDPHLELDVLLAATAASSAGEVPPDLLARINRLDNQERRYQLLARLAVHLDVRQTRLLVARVNLRWLPAEPARALLEAVRLHGVEVEPHWVPMLVHQGNPLLDRPGNPTEWGRVAHLLAAIPEPLRTEHADWLAQAACNVMSDAWYVAYMVSVAGPWVSSPDVWDALREFEPFWDTFIRELTAAPAVSPHEALLRSHPLRTAVESVPGRHEPTERIVDELGRWTPLMAAAPDPIPPPLPSRESEPASGSGRRPDIVNRDPRPNPPPAPPPGPSRSVDLDGDAPTQPRALQADVVVNGRRRTRTFALGVPNTVRFSIGRNAAISTGEAFPDVDAGGRDEVVLPVWLHCPGNDPVTTSVVLPTDNNLDSTWATLTFTPDKAWVKDIVAIVYGEDGTEVLQAASLRGAAVAPELNDADQSNEQLEFHRTDVRGIDEAPSSISFATVVHTESTTAVTAAGGRAVALGASTEATSEMIRQYMAALESTAASLDLGIGDITRTLVRAARFGALLATQLPTASRLAVEDHIRVISVVNSVVMPLELIYDGVAPDADAVLCDGWREALTAPIGTSCAACGNRPGNATVVCPLRFWSMSKVLEHHGPTLADTPAVFSAHAVSPSASAPTVNPFASAVIAASDKIPSGEDSPVAALAAITSGFGTETTVVDTWSEWVTEVQERDPSLLIAMAHQDVDPNGLMEVPALEIGGTLQTIFDRRYVRPTADSTPGPVVILLGCNTAVDPGNSIASLASIFKGQGAATVISSLGEIIASQAVPSAQTLMQSMKSAFDTPGATIGDALLETRRRLLADNKLLGLMLVMHGGSDLGAAN